MADGAAASLGHALHDRLLVAAEADRRGAGVRTPSPMGRALLAACTGCAELYADLVALAAALPTVATPRRTRDFTLTAADAERLRPRGMRAWLARIGSPGETFSKPLAMGFTTLGLAGLLVATAPTVLPLAGGTAGSAGSGTEVSGSAAPAIDHLRIEAPPAASDGSLRQDGGGRATSGEAPRPPTPTVSASSSGDAGHVPVVVLSAAFLTVGGGLFVLRRRVRMG